MDILRCNKITVVNAIRDEKKRTPSHWNACYITRLVIGNNYANRIIDDWGHEELENLRQQWIYCDEVLSRLNHIYVLKADGLLAKPAPE